MPLLPPASDTERRFAPVGISVGPLDVGEHGGGERVALSTPLLLAHGVSTKTCPHCGIAPAATSRHRSFLGSGRTVFASVSTCAPCQRLLVLYRQARQRPIFYTVVGLTVVTLAGIAGGGLTFALTLASWPFGIAWSLKKRRTMRLDDIQCESIDEREVILRVPKTWQHVLAKEQPELLLEPTPSSRERAP